MACFLVHKWNGCKCEKCGKNRKCNHDFEWADECTLKCKKCGEILMNHNHGREIDYLKCPGCGKPMEYYSSTFFIMSRKDQTIVFLKVIDGLDGLKKLMNNNEIAFTDILISKFVTHLQDLKKAGNSHTKWTEFKFSIEEFITICVVLESAFFGFSKEANKIVVEAMEKSLLDRATRTNDPFYGKRVESFYYEKTESMSCTLSHIYRELFKGMREKCSIEMNVEKYMQRIASLEKILTYAQSIQLPINLPIVIREMIFTAKN